MNYQRVKFKLINHDTNTDLWLEHDPKNWDSSEKTLKRSTKNFAITTELSKNLVFVKEGATFLKEAYMFKDLEANVELYEYRFHPKTSKPYLHSTGFLDFSEYSANKIEVKVPFTSGGLNALITAQIKEKFELERLESINGKTINEVDKKTVALTSRKIFLVSGFEADDENNEAKLSVESNAGNTRSKTCSLPLNLISQSHEQAQNTISISKGGNTNGTATMMFFLNADRQRTLNIDFNTNFDAFVQQYEDVGWAYYKVNLTIFENGNTFDVKERIELTDLADSVKYPDQPFGGGSFGVWGQWTVNMSAEYKGTIVLEAGESAAIELHLRSDMNTSNTAGVRVYAQNVTGSLTIEEDSFFEDSQTEAITVHDAGDKLMQIITGEQGRFYSEFYGTKDLGYEKDGEFSLTAFTTGFWIRQFYEETIEMSLNNLLNTTNVLHNTSYFIDIIDGYETLVLENLEFFFQNAVAIDLPDQVTDLEYNSAKDFCYSSLGFGYKEGGEYEEAMGLDEYNTKSSFTLPITRSDKKHEKYSDARADKYGQEFARRKPKESYPTEDTSYDSDLHLLDLKKGFGEALEERIWSDDFDELPENVYSPETATNLRLTPSQIEQRHQWFYASCLHKEQDEKVMYSSGDGNKELTLTKDGLKRKENDNVNVSLLNKPIFIPKWATFDHPIDYYVNEQLTGRTKVNGREIPNIYFKVRFKDDEGKKQTGFLFEQKKKDSKLGTFKLLMSK